MLCLRKVWSLQERLSSLGKTEKIEPGKLESSESVRQKLDELTRKNEISTKNVTHSPFIQIQIRQQVFPALLDSGASLSVISDKVYDRIQNETDKLALSSKSIGLAIGSCSSSSTINLPVSWTNGQTTHTFSIIEGMSHPIILGRDFLVKNKFVLDIPNGGWQYSYEPGKQYDFIKVSQQSFHITMLQEFISELEEVCFLFEKDTLLLSTTNNTELSESDLDAMLVNLQLPQKEYLAVRQILHKFSSIFKNKPGEFGNYEFTIDTKDHAPIKCHPRPMNAAKREILRELLQKMITDDLIEPASGPWAFNPVIVPKKNGKMRLCIDYRPLNKITVADSYGMPRVDDILACLARAKYISVFDLSAGFHHLKIVQSHRPKTAFNTPWGTWQFRRMPFGVINGPSKFQKAIDNIIGQFKWDFVIAYIDDLIVYSDTLEDHIRHLRVLFDTLAKNNVNLNPEKVQFFKNRVSYLGFIIEDGKCFPDPDKLKSLEGYKVPNNVKEVQRFLGFAGYYRQFIQNFSLTTKPLTNLLKKGQKFVWSSDCQAAFDSLRVSLIGAQSLKLPDLNKSFIIQTDASDYGIGCVLLQESDEGRLPVYFASRCLTPSELNYSVTEKECLSIIFAVKKFRPYIEYTNFVIETDHQALTWLMGIKEPVGRLARWALELQGYNFDVRYKAGKLNKTADALSRAFTIALIDSSEIITREALIRAQQNDSELASIIDYVETGKLPVGPRESLDGIIKKAKDAFVCKDGCLLKLIGPREKPWESEVGHWNIWVPLSLKDNIMSYYHSALVGCHLGIQKTYKKLEDRFWWKSMHKDVVKFVVGCEICQKVKASRKGPVGIGKAPNIPEPWEVVTIDLIGPYTRTSNNNTCALVLVDSFTKWVEIFAIRKATSQVIVRRLYETFCRWGFPKTIISDNGSQFRSHYYINWCETMGINNLYIAPYHANANPTERYNQTIKAMIISTIKQCKERDKYTNEISFALRTSINESSAFTPCYLNTGREFRNPLDNHLQIPHKGAVKSSEFSRRLHLIQTLARSNLIKSQEKYLGAYNKRRRQVSYDMGDLVWLRTHFLSDASKKITASLLPKYDGPFKVVGKRGNDTYELLNIKTDKKAGFIHVSDLKPYHLYSGIDSYNNGQETDEAKSKACTEKSVTCDDA